MIQAFGFSAVDGLLGATFLARYHACVDFAAGVLYLQMPTEP